MDEKEKICDFDVIGILFAISVITKRIARMMIKSKVEAKKKVKED